MKAIASWLAFLLIALLVTTGCGNRSAKNTTTETYEETEDTTAAALPQDSASSINDTTKILTSLTDSLFTDSALLLKQHLMADTMRQLPDSLRLELQKARDYMHRKQVRTIDE